MIDLTKNKRPEKVEYIFHCIQHLYGSSCNKYYVSWSPKNIFSSATIYISYKVFLKTGIPRNNIHHKVQLAQSPWSFVVIKNILRSLWHGTWVHGASHMAHGTWVTYYGKKKACCLSSLSICRRITNWTMGDRKIYVFSITKTCNKVFKLRKILFPRCVFRS